jgi:hypothetical protein
VIGQPPAFGNDGFSAIHLCAAERGLKIGHALIVTRLWMVGEQIGPWAKVPGSL